MSQPSEDSAAARLARVRHCMENYSMDAFLVFSADAHQSEYVADFDKRRAYLSGFKGSAGTAVVTRNDAALWTDGRYFNQASLELPPQWTLMRSGLPGVPEIGPWLAERLTSGQVVGVDSTLVSAKEAKALQTWLAASNIKLVALLPSQPNPVDVAWDEQAPASCVPRPLPPATVARVHPVKYAGMSHVEKLRSLQQEVAQKGADFSVISALDEIAWLFNLRGSDVTFNPVVKAYAVVLSGREGRDAPLAKKAKTSPSAVEGNVFLFIEESKLSDEVTAHLHSGNNETTENAVKIVVKPYSNIVSFLSECLNKETIERKGKVRVLLDSSSLNWGVYGAVQGKEVEIKDCPSVVAATKTLKNPVERRGIRACHVRDGVALTAFLSWLEEYMASAATAKGGEGSISEHEAAVKLETFRAAMPLYVSPSFDTISSYGSNGAIIHYHPPSEGSALLGHSSLYLLDSGGQYLDGTTDVTRTLYFGPCDLEEGSEAADKLMEMRNAFTLVLKAHIALATAKFPENTMGYRLDAITRAPLWAAGLDYSHGTGHGVGAYLNVHEGPQGIGIRPRQGDMGFKADMTTSNEPGYYKEGDYGIRIENVCLTVSAEVASFPLSASTGGGKNFLAFETVTMCPLDRRLINVDLLSDVEAAWVDSYHSRVRAALLEPLQERFPEAELYLMHNTEPLTR